MVISDKSIKFIVLNSTKYSYRYAHRGQNYQNFCNGR